jgi:glutamate--cysteine ligase catalytic subunit
VACCEGFFQTIPPVNGTSHFENLQSTNWNTVRFKIPPTADSKIGWRVEFRPLDIQLTDFENAAFVVTIGMIANILNTFALDFMLPISKVDENMLRA